MKIYVITSGSYSDYHICGVATDKDTAEFIMNECSKGYDSAEIEEYDTDCWCQFRKGAKCYTVYLNESGNVEHRKSSLENTSDDINCVHCITPHRGNRYFYVSVMARDEDHAKKIGLDLIYASKYYLEMYGDGRD